MIQKSYVHADANVSPDAASTGEEMVCRVIFQLPASIWADTVYLVGDFNDWNRRSHPMTRDHSERWTIVLDLEVNQSYQFRYLCDGEWMNDNQADAYWPNPHGSYNSVLVTDPDYDSDAI